MTDSDHVTAPSRARARRPWMILAVLGLVSGFAVLIVGDRLSHQGLRLAGALIAAAGFVCAVVPAVPRE